VAPAWLDPYTVRAPYLGVANDNVDDQMNAMSYRSATSRSCMVWHQVDGSPGIVAASLHRGVESSCTVAYLLRVFSRSAPYYCRPAMSLSCAHLMLVIHRVWLVLYAFNALLAPRAW
jgi:hypothetical protein